MWQPGWEGALGKMDTCMCMAESLQGSPETSTVLLISYISMQNKKFKQKEGAVKCQKKKEQERITQHIGIYSKISQNLIFM